MRGTTAPKAVGLPWGSQKRASGESREAAPAAADLPPGSDPEAEVEDQQLVSVTCYVQGFYWGTPQMTQKGNCVV